MIKTTSFTANENIDLSRQIVLVGANDTPLSTFLLNKNLVENAGSVTINWREKTLDNTEDISRVEGFTTTDFYESGRAEKSNVMEIFSKAVNISGSAQASDVTGISDLMASEINDRLTEIKVNAEKKLFAKANYNDGSSSPYVRRMKSLFEQVHADNIVTLSATPTLDSYTFKSIIKKLWDNGLGSNEFYCFVNADYKELIDSFYSDQVNYSQPMSVYGFVANRIITNFGTVNVVLNRHVPTDSIVLVDPSYLRISYLRKPFYELLAKDGDNIKGQVLTECSLKVYNSKAIAIGKPA